MDSFNPQELFIKFRYPLIIFLIGILLTLGGIFFIKSGFSFGGTKVEVLTEGGETSDNQKNVTAEISGEVILPGVYKLSGESRVDDLLIAADGFSQKADRDWCNKYLNRAAKITDGQKIYIPSVNQQSSILSAKKSGEDQTISGNISSDSKGLININSASLGELDTLPGIGQIYGQSIVEHRPYSNIEELLSKGVLKKSVYEKLKDRISIY
jgi:competence protein ComEA